MFNFKSICKSTLTITTLLLSTFSVFSIPNSPKVQAGAGNVLNLIVNSKTSTDGTNWTNQQNSNGGNYQQFMCDSEQFNLPMTPNNSPKIKGISDYEDGLTKKNIQLKPNTGFVGTFRDCGDYNSKSNGQPVFAYQYSFEYKFAADKKASESARYRVHTSQNGDYDGVLYTFTYYNYWNPQKNAWNGWENPNFNNELGGFLAYAMKSEMGVPKIGALPKLDEKNSQNQAAENFEDILKYVTASQGLSVFDSKKAKYSIENEKAKSFNKFYNDDREIRVVGKRKNLNSDTNGKPYYQITEITKVDRVQTLSGGQTSQNSNKPTNSQIAKNFIEESGNCSVPGQHILPLNSKVDCNFSFMNFNSQQNIENYIKNGGKIRAEIVAASSSGRSDFCILKTETNAIGAYLKCPNTPTGSKGKNGYLLNPSPIALFFEGDEVGYSNGQVMIDYDQSSKSSSNNSNANEVFGGKLLNNDILMNLYIKGSDVDGLYIFENEKQLVLKGKINFGSTLGTMELDGLLNGQKVGTFVFDPIMNAEIKNGNIQKLSGFYSSVKEGGKVPFTLTNK